MKWLVCGGRDYTDRARLTSSLDELYVKYGCQVLVHGAARGADRMAGEWAKLYPILVKEYPADWAHMGPKAGIVRNIRMLETELPDLVVAFPTGGNGTAHMMKIAKQQSKCALIVFP